MFAAEGADRFWVGTNQGESGNYAYLPACIIPSTMIYGRCSFSHCQCPALRVMVMVRWEGDEGRHRDALLLQGLLRLDSAAWTWPDWWEWGLRGKLTNRTVRSDASLGERRPTKSPAGGYVLTEQRPCRGWLWSLEGSAGELTCAWCQPFTETGRFWEGALVWC